MHDEVTLHADLEGQVALVTGANRGIGRAIADQLADHGATVVAGVREPSDVTREGRGAVRLDVTDREQVSRAIDQVVDQEGGLDVLVNNAGVYGPREPLHEADPAGVEQTYAVNLLGATLCARAAIPHLLDGDGGRIVNVSSRSGQLTGGMGSGGAQYAASKAGLNGLTVSLDGTYGEEGLIVNSASPGWVATDMGGDEAPRTPAEGADTPAWLARFAPGSPSGRFWHDRAVIDW
ncbi:MAG: SDR family NAD(P)-dependent oxidoreductase [Halobacteriaceae archaeon]